MAFTFPRPARLRRSDPGARPQARRYGPKSGQRAMFTTTMGNGGAPREGRGVAPIRPTSILLIQSLQ